MTNQEQYDKICEDSERLKALEEKAGHDGKAAQRAHYGSGKERRHN